MRSRAWLLPAVAVAVAVLVASPARAAGRWSKPQRVAASVDNFDMAAGAGGHAAIAWVGSDGGGGSSISIAIRRPGGRFAPSVRVADVLGSVSTPDVAVDAAGNALVVWSDTARVWWAECAITCSAPLLLADSADEAVANAQAGFLANGDAVAAWSHTSRSTAIGQVVSALKRPGAGDFDAAVVVGDSERGAPILAAGGDTTVLTWAASVPATRDGIVAALRHGSGSFGLVRVAESMTPNAGTLAATVDYAGAATIAWLRNWDGPKAEITRARPGAGFMPIERVGAASPYSPESLSLTSGPPGKLAIAWIGQSSLRPRMEVAALRGSGKLRRRTIYTDPTRIPTFSEPNAAWTVNGSLATAWMAEVAGRSRPQARVLPPAGRAPLPAMLGPAGDSQPRHLQLVGARRDAIAAWRRGNALEVSIR